MTASVSSLGDAGPLLDDQTKKEYNISSGSMISHQNWKKPENSTITREPNISKKRWKHLKKNLPASVVWAVEPKNCT
jgi:hypothetical protein